MAKANLSAAHPLSYCLTVRPIMGQDRRGRDLVAPKAIYIDPVAFAEVAAGRLPEADKQKVFGHFTTRTYEAIVKILEERGKINVLKEEMVGAVEPYPNIEASVKSRSSDKNYTVKITAPPKKGEKFKLPFKADCECKANKKAQRHYGETQDTNYLCYHVARVIAELSEERGLDPLLDFMGDVDKMKLAARTVEEIHVKRRNRFDTARHILTPYLERAFAGTLKQYELGGEMRYEPAKHSLPKAKADERRRHVEGVLPIFDDWKFELRGLVVEGGLSEKDDKSRLPFQVVFDQVRGDIHARIVKFNDENLKVKLLTTEFNPKRVGFRRTIDDATKKVAAYVLVDIEPAGGLNPRKFNDGMTKITSLLPRRLATA